MGISRRKPLSLRDTLKKPSSPKVSQRHVPFSGEERLRELMKIAARFEAKNYAIAMSEYEISASMSKVRTAFSWKSLHELQSLGTIDRYCN
ncbi:hypothetical protein CUMW_252920 [Citrus unshiu]|uniref:Mediator complex subunit 15 KIX domain-containing protein n=1 Tax=Citrus unshiu TaxID=55188 RepID=A0A2H5QQV3_CITUN|nr:hypothetical protein CUMW_252920 [Citrus unshiu]